MQKKSTEVHLNSKRGTHLYKLQAAIGYRFKHLDLLHQAMTHCSYSASNNERLEFLGDAVLGLAISDHLYQTLATENEGTLSRLRSNLVRESILNAAALRLELGNYLLLGMGEVKTGGVDRPSILADALEALLGAIYLDQQGDTSAFSIAKQHAIQMLTPELNALPTTLISQGNVVKDAKTSLQEYLQGKRLSKPIYTIIEVQGEIHDQTFLMRCQLNELNLESHASGKTKKAAEQLAAESMLTLIQNLAPNKRL